MNFILQFVADEDDKLDIARLMKKEHVLFFGGKLEIDQKDADDDDM